MLIWFQVVITYLKLYLNRFWVSMGSFSGKKKTLFIYMIKNTYPIPCMYCIKCQNWLIPDFVILNNPSHRFNFQGDWRPIIPASILSSTPQVHCTMGWEGWIGDLRVLLLEPWHVIHQNCRPIAGFTNLEESAQKRTSLRSNQPSKMILQTGRLV